MWIMLLPSHSCSDSWCLSRWPISDPGASYLVLGLWQTESLAPVVQKVWLLNGMLVSCQIVGISVTTLMAHRDNRMGYLKCHTGMSRKRWPLRQPPASPPCKNDFRIFCSTALSFWSAHGTHLYPQPCHKGSLNAFICISKFLQRF